MARVNTYHVWCNLKDGRRDLEFARAVSDYLGTLQRSEKIHGWRLERRKLGFGPTTLGEFHVAIETEDLAQLDRAFSTVARRTGEVEDLHRGVWSLATDLTFALYRDFPDPERRAQQDPR
jgi:hypothetical protein